MQTSPQHGPNHPRLAAATRLRRAAAVAAVAGFALLGSACSQDTSEGGSSPEDQRTGGAQQPGGGGEDPTLSGEGTSGVGEGNTGGDGSGAPDSGSGAGSSGSAGDSPTAGEDG
ncbi:MAG: hypothetical protein M3503_02260 [Actinomycetota bacterium]|nr:hypothetical protein [Actinomycetota bacterium]